MMVVVLLKEKLSSIVYDSDDDIGVVEKKRKLSSTDDDIGVVEKKKKLSSTDDDIGVVEKKKKLSVYDKKKRKLSSTDDDDDDLHLCNNSSTHSDQSLKKEKKKSRDGEKFHNEEKNNNSSSSNGIKFNINIKNDHDIKVCRVADVFILCIVSMCAYVHKSGFQKRKERKERKEKGKLKGLQPIIQFLKSAESDECPKAKEGDELAIASTNKSDTTADLQSDKHDPGSSSVVTVDLDIDSVFQLQSSEEAAVDIVSESIQDQAQTQQVDLADVGLWPDHITDNLRQNIVSLGVPKAEVMLQIIKMIPKDMKDDHSDMFEIHERFIEFIMFHKKTGEDIGDMVLSRLDHYKIPFSDCRGQGYDNGSNMSGKVKGVQARLHKKNNLAEFSPCGAHTLNLTGVHAAALCPETVTFFGCVQRLYVFFSGSQQDGKF
ncbi:transcriptional regulator ATRX homolog [Macrobrachium rosenbergii]|uniref:transcriptional regulator ATRX homolog n=1 Tax=Macrobrachium rosenbergii TaxID=79674 RepID=UPI0034D5F71F